MELKMKGCFNNFEIDRLEWFCNLYRVFCVTDELILKQQNLYRAL